jgi:hypothetical protein
LRSCLEVQLEKLSVMNYKLKHSLLGIFWLVASISSAYLAIISWKKIPYQQIKEQPWLTIKVYRDSVTYNIGDYKPEQVGYGINMMNSQYEILINKLPGNEKNIQKSSFSTIPAINR